MPISADNNRLYTEDGKGITLDEIAACLKDYCVTALGRDLGLLATSPNIEMMSKHKPVVWPSWTWSRHDHPMHYRGSDGRCGINYWTINQYDVMGGLVSDDVNVADRPYITDLIKSRTSAQDMSYRFIKGGASEPARVLDFDGYDHNASTIWYINYMPIGAGKPDVIGANQFRVGAYAYSTALSNDNPTSLALIDIMQGLKADGDTSLVVYTLDESKFTDVYNYGFVRDYGIDYGESYGYIGMLAAVYDDEQCYGVSLCSKSVGRDVGDDLQSFSANGEAVMGIIGAYPGRKLMLIPIVCNYCTDMNWLVFGLDAMPHFKAIPFPISKKHYMEEELSRAISTTIKADIETYPEDNNQGSGYVIATNTSGGISLVVSERIYGTLTIRLRTASNVTLKTITVTESGAKNYTLIGWQNNVTGSLFYKNGYTTGLYALTGIYSTIFIDLSYDAQTDDIWVEQRPNWVMGSSTIIVTR